MSMEYRKLGRTGLDVSAIGLGTEHLERDKKMMDRVLGTAVEAGLSYVDLLYIEPDYWDAYGSIYKTYRDRLVAAAHWGYNPDIDYCQRCFDGMLSHLGNNYAEVAMLAVVDKEQTWDEWARESIERLQTYKEQGRVGYIGMSGHTVSTALKAINSGLIDVLMFHANPICNVYYEGNSELYQTCTEKGVGLVAMKPYAGGTLLYLDGKPTGITPAQCLHYVLSLPVSTTVPGPRNIEQLEATLHYLEATDEEKECSSIMDSIHQSLVGHCVYCNHCLPCPQNIDIGMTLCLADWAKAGVSDDLMNFYNDFPAKASDCVECGQCVERCPFDVDVIPKMRKAAEIFDTNTS